MEGEAKKATRGQGSLVKESIHKFTWNGKRRLNSWLFSPKVQVEEATLLGFQPERVNRNRASDRDLLHEKMKCLFKPFNTQALKRKG